MTRGCACALAPPDELGLIAAAWVALLAAVLIALAWPRRRRWQP